MKMILMMAVAAMAVSASAQDNPKPRMGGSAQMAEMQRAMQDPDYVFARMDTNRDGMISKAEFRAAHAQMRERMSEHREHRMDRRMERRQQR